MEVDEKSTKSKRNSEKRKEKSRFAAKCRRSKESEIFSDLAKALPIKESTCLHLDKATIMRLAIAYLRIRNLFTKRSFFSLPENQLIPADEKLSLQALGGIIMILTAEGDIIYVSNNVNSYLGLTQIDLMGQNVFDVSHPCDHKEIKDILSGKLEMEGNFSIFIRLKSTLTSNGRSVNLKSATYKCMHIIGTMVTNESAGSKHFTAIASPIAHPANIEMPLGSYTFLSKHSLDMKFTYADDRMKNFLGYSPEDLIGKSLYEFHHVLDYTNIQNSFKSLFAKGQSETNEYRFLVKGGGFVWVYTQATVIYSDKATKPESVVCVNYIVSERLNMSEIYSSYQLESQQVLHKPVPSTPKVIVKISSAKLLERPLHSTRKIFAPRTPEMNKGFLTFADDDSGLLFKDEPEDLTHLAPTAGDVCISLDPLNCSLVDQFKSKINNDSFLLHQDDKTKMLLPLLDDASACLSPALSKSSDSSLPSLCHVDEAIHYGDPVSAKAFLSFDSNDNTNDDMSFKAPYISMSEGDDLPLLMNPEFWPGSYSNCASSVESSCAPSPMELICSDDNMDKVIRKDNQDFIESCQDAGGGTLYVHDYKQENQYLSEADTRKRSNMDVSNSADSLSKKRKQDTSGCVSNSVLVNLLVTGHDVNAGYMCINTRKKNSPD